MRILLSFILFLAGAAGAPRFFVQLTDTHLGKPAPYETADKMGKHADNLREAIREVNAVIRPEFVVVTGDCISTTDEDSVKLFAREIKALSMPVYVIPGNHDEGAVKAGWFERHVGPTRMVIRRAGWHVVAFDGRPVKRDDGPAAAELFEWIRAQFKGPAANEEIRLLACHYPLHIDASWSNQAATRPFFQLTGPLAIRLNLLLAEAGIAAYIAGHTHAVYGVQDVHSNVTSLNSGATQNGAYRIHASDAGVFSSAPVETGKWPKIVVTAPQQRYEGGREFVSGRVLVSAAVFSPRPVKKVECRIDEGAAQPMRCVEPGVWQAEIDTRNVANGKHTITVAARTEATGGEKQITVAISNRAQ